MLPKRAMSRVIDNHEFVWPVVLLDEIEKSAVELVLWFFRNVQLEDFCRISEHVLEQSL